MKMRRQPFPYRYVVTFFLFFLLCRLFPYTGDDWTWGGPIGIERLHVFFRDYGGRYLGYLIVLVLTRSVWLRALAMAVIYTGTCILIEKNVCHSLSFYISLFFFLAMPKLVLRQAVVWTSGFSNYGFATFFSLLFALYALSRFKEPEANRNRYQNAFSALLLFLLGLCNSLILENMTLYMVCMSVLVLLACRKQHQTWDIPTSFHLVGTLLGALLMFSNSAYHNILAGSDTYSYRQISTSSITQRIIDNWHIIYQEGFLNNLLLNTAFFVVCFLCVAVLVFYRQPSAKVLTVLLFLFGSYIIWSFFSLLYVTDSRSDQLTAIEGLFSFVALLSLFSFIWLAATKPSFTDKNSISNEILYFTISFFLMLAPLFPVFPIGSRCFYSSYIFLVVLLCELVKTLDCYLTAKADTDQKRLIPVRSLVKRSLIACTSVMYAILLLLFFSIFKVDAGRLSYIREQVASGETEIEIQHYPYESFLWNATPAQDTKWETRYKLYYHLPDDIILTPVWDS